MIVVEGLPVMMNRSPGTGLTIFLYIFGIALITVAVVLLLQGSGVIKTIPNYLIIALVLISIGGGILAGLRTLNRR